MDISWTTAPTFESVVTARRASFLQDLSNTAQASDQKSQAKAVGQFTDTAQNLLSINTGAGFSSDPFRGQNLDVTV